jgi:hypothetical protein
MNIIEILSKINKFQEKQKKIKEQGKKTFFKRIKWKNVAICIPLLMVFIVGAITIFKWSFIGNGKIEQTKTPIGSYYCKGGAIFKICWTDNNDVYDAYGR